MKCPKCGFISFDYLQNCPKCEKDISLERERYNLPSYKPDPPSLLGGLLKAKTEASIGLRIQKQETSAAGDKPVDFGQHDHQAIEEMEAALDDDSDIGFEIEAEPVELTEESSDSIDIAVLDQPLPDGEDTAAETSFGIEDLTIDDSDADGLLTDAKTDDGSVIGQEPKLDSDSDIVGTNGSALPDGGESSVAANIGELLLDKEESTLEFEVPPAPADESPPNMDAPAKTATSEGEDVLIELEDLDLDIDLPEDK